MKSGTVRALYRPGVVALVAMGLSLVVPVRASAQVGTGGSPGLSEAPIGGTTAGGLPSTSISPAKAPSAKPTAAPYHHRTAPVVRHHRTTGKTARAAAPLKFTVEPAKARLRLKQDTPIHS